MPVAAEIYYHVCSGEGAESAPVVLLHGAGGSGLFWPPELRRLPSQRIFAPDLPGHGKSEGRGQQSIEGYARQVIAWLDALQLYQAVFVGHSMGAAIAIELGLSFSDHVLGLVLIGGGGRIPVGQSILDNASNSTTFPNAVSTIVHYGFNPQSDPRIVEEVEQRLLETRSSVFYGDFLACNTFDATERLANIHQPTLVICGAEDRLVPLRNSQLLAGAISGARLQVISGAGHFVILEKPAEVARALADFVPTILYHPGDVASS